MALIKAYGFRQRYMFGVPDGGKTDLPTRAQLDNLVLLIRSLKKNIPSIQIVNLHRHYGAWNPKTHSCGHAACPGERFPIDRVLGAFFPNTQQGLNIQWEANMSRIQIGVIYPNTEGRGACSRHGSYAVTRSRRKRKKTATSKPTPKQVKPEKATPEAQAIVLVPVPMINYKTEVHNLVSLFCASYF